MTPSHARYKAPWRPAARTTHTQHTPDMGSQGPSFKAPSGKSVHRVDHFCFIAMAHYRRRTCPLLGVKRTCRFALHMSGFDPKRTSGKDTRKMTGSGN